MPSVPDIVEVMSHPVSAPLTLPVHKPSVRLKRQNFSGI